MSTPLFEAFLAKLYTDAAFRTRFLSDRRGTAAAVGLTKEQIEAVVQVDAEELDLASHGFEKKRAKLRRK